MTQPAARGRLRCSPSEPNNLFTSSRAASITVKDELIYGHLRPWLGESEGPTSHVQQQEWSHVTGLSVSLLHPRAESAAEQRGGVVSQEAAADSRVPFRCSEELRCKVQHLSEHHACKITGQRA